MNVTVRENANGPTEYQRAQKNELSKEFDFSRLSCSLDKNHVVFDVDQS